MKITRMDHGALARISRAVMGVTSTNGAAAAGREAFAYFPGPQTHHLATAGLLGFLMTASFALPFLIEKARILP